MSPSLSSSNTLAFFVSWEGREPGARIGRCGFFHLFSGGVARGGKQDGKSGVIGGVCMFVHVDCWCQLDAPFFHLYFPVTFTVSPPPSPKCPAYCAPLTPPNRFWWKEKHKMSSAVKTLIWSGTKWGLTGHSASLFEDLTKSINVHS